MCSLITHLNVFLSAWRVRILWCTCLECVCARGDGRRSALENVTGSCQETERKRTVDWAVRDSVRARLRIIIRNLLKRYKYPPDEQKGAVEIVLRQAEVCQKMWWHEMTGRNERFPCGSGKKYKVCCLGNILELPTQKQNADVPIPGSIFNVNAPTKPHKHIPQP